MLIFLIVVGLIWLVLTICSYIDEFKPDSLIYGLISVLFGILLVTYLSVENIPTIEDYKSGNYKMKITTEIINGEMKSDTLYLKK